MAEWPITSAPSIPFAFYSESEASDWDEAPTARAVYSNDSRRGSEVSMGSTVAIRSALKPATPTGFYAADSDGDGSEWYAPFCVWSARCMYVQFPPGRLARMKTGAAPLGVLCRRSDLHQTESVS
jgi:hypothetical protein